MHNSPLLPIPHFVCVCVCVFLEKAILGSLSSICRNFVVSKYQTGNTSPV